MGSVRAEEGSAAGFVQGTSEVYIASLQGDVSVWDPRPEAAVGAACTFAGRELTEVEWAAYLPSRDPKPVCSQ